MDYQPRKKSSDSQTLSAERFGPKYIPRKGIEEEGYTGTGCLTKCRFYNKYLQISVFRAETELKVGVARFNLKKSCVKKLT